jgi:integrase
MNHPRIKITEGVRAERLSAPLTPSITRDAQVPGFALVVTKRGAHWDLYFQAPGRRPDGRRYGGGARVTLADAFLMPVREARNAALAAKQRIREGHDPLKEQQARKAAAVAQRALAPTLARDALALYDKAIKARSEPKLKSRLQHLSYVGKALRLLDALDRPLEAIGAGSIRIMLETMQASGSERRHVYLALAQFLAWCRKNGLASANPCDDLDRADRPRGGKSRDHTPSVSTLRAVWQAVENEQPHVRDLVRFMLLLPLRRTEACLLRWREVDLEARRITLSADRMKNKTGFVLPLSRPAFELMATRRPASAKLDDFVFPTAEGKPFSNWLRLLARVRRAIGEGETDRNSRFSPHDIRRSFVSELAERGLDPDLLDLMLAHARPGVFGVYQRSSRMGERKSAIELWGSLITGENISSNVVQINAGR